MKRSEIEHHLQLVTDAESSHSSADATDGAGDLRLREEQLLSWAFGEIGTHIREITPSPETAQRVMTAFDRELRIKRRYAHAWLRYAAGIAAAVLFVTVASFALLRHRPNSASPGNTSPNELNAAVATVESLHVTASPPGSQVKPKRQVSGSKLARNQTQRSAGAEAPPEIATDFIRLNVGPIEPGDQIVRVQLPRSAMAQFGLPVNMDRSDKPVKADVIMGIDGVAQAIRFVQ